MKIKKWILILFLLICVGGMMFFYRFFLFHPQKIEIVTDNIIEIDDVVKIEEISNSKVVLICTIDNKYNPYFEIDNYVLGKKFRVKVNYSVLIKRNDEFYKLHTLYNSKEDTKYKNCFDAYANKKDLSEELYIYNHDTNILFKLKGVVDE